MDGIELFIRLVNEIHNDEPKLKEKSPDEC